MKTYKSESDYLANYNIHDFNVPLCTVDMTIFTVQNDSLQVLLVKRQHYPKINQWSLPGGFINTEKDWQIEDTAFKKLKEKTGVATPYLEQVATIGNTKRDPRGWSLTVLYFALIPFQILTLPTVAWVPYESIKKRRLAFDHSALIERSFERLRSKTLYTSLPIHLLPEKFTLPQLQRAYETLLDSPVQKRSFRKRLLDANIIEETGEMEPGITRPAMLYRLIDKNTIHTFPRTLECVDDPR